MPEWMIMVALTTHVTFVGPFDTEERCQMVKQVIFKGKTAVCVETTFRWKIAN